jgi:fatty acid desaturase
MATQLLERESAARKIDWYRTQIETEELRKLYERSDAKGLTQTLGYLAVILATGTAAYYSAYHWPWWATVLLVFLHGTCFAFQINAVHEIGHYTVFKSKWLGTVFVHLFAFLGWINHRMFEQSHSRHHRSTLHPPDDLEVVVPITHTLKSFLQFGFLNWGGPKWVLPYLWRTAHGRFQGEWELKLFPEDNPERRQYAASWSRTVLIGHALLIVVSLCLKLWMIPVLVSLASFYGGWLFWLCNNTQHVGLQDNVSDFRLCCRTFIPNPIVRFLYWHMNYHTEHHMYVGVPCYNLARLHKLIEHDLPPTPVGLVATWREIGAILEKQAEDPEYQHVATVPNRAGAAAA